MILWCVKCREFRKKNTPDWHECRYSSRHTLVPGHERMEKEMRQARERISSSGKPRTRTSRGSGRWRQSRTPSPTATTRGGTSLPWQTG